LFDAKELIEPEVYGADIGLVKLPFFTGISQWSQFFSQFSQMIPTNLIGQLPCDFAAWSFMRLT
jgi:hypothetical protein